VREQKIGTAAPLPAYLIAAMRRHFFVFDLNQIRARQAQTIVGLPANDFKPLLRLHR
jgi:hypothetical protein